MPHRFLPFKTIYRTIDDDGCRNANQLIVKYPQDQLQNCNGKILSNDLFLFERVVSNILCLRHTQTHTQTYALGKQEIENDTD